MAAVRRSGSGTSTTSMRPPSLPSIPDLDYLDDISGLQLDGEDGEKEVVVLGGPNDYLSPDERIAVAATRARARTVVTVASFPSRYASPPPTSSSRSSTCFEKEASIPYPVQRSKSQSTMLQTRSPPVRVNTPDLSYQNRPKSVSCLGDLLYQSKALSHTSPNPSYHSTSSSLTSSNTLLESWTITYHAPVERLTTRYSLLGLPFPLCRRTEIEEGRILSITPNTHFAQSELLSEIASDKAHFTARTGKPPSMHSGDLDRRIRCLDWKVQDEIYDLLNDRAASSSNAFRRREWKVVVLVAVEAGEIMTERRVSDGGKSSKTRGGGKRRRLLDGASGGLLRNVLRKEKKMPKAPVTEYRLILRGREAKVSEEGWGYYNRYTRPWRSTVDNNNNNNNNGKNAKATSKEIGVKRRWSSMSTISTMTARTARSEPYVDF